MNFFLPHLLKGFQTYSGLFLLFFVCFLNLYFLLCVFLHQWGLSGSPSLPNFVPFPYFGQILGGRILVCQKYMLSIIQFHAGS